MKKPLSMDLRQRILKAYDQGRSTREEVAARYEVSLGMVKKLIQQRYPFAVPHESQVLSADTTPDSGPGRQGT